VIEEEADSFQHCVRTSVSSSDHSPKRRAEFIFGFAVLSLQARTLAAAREPSESVTP
jgi:hypothetical protein